MLARVTTEPFPVASNRSSWSAKQKVMAHPSPEYSAGWATAMARPSGVQETKRQSDSGEGVIRRSPDPSSFTT